MRFLTVRDLKNNSSKIWKELPEEQEMIITNNGRPIAILSSIDEYNLESSLNSIRRSRLISTISSVQKESTEKGNNKISLEEINQEVQKARKALK